MNKYLEKAEILTKFFGIYGRGNFDLSLEETAHIIKMLCEKDKKDYLEVNLQEIYERLEKQRMG